MPRYLPIGDQGHYRVGDDGSVWTCRVERSRTRTGPWQPMKLRINPNGYLYVILYFGDQMKNRPVHQLVAEAFLGPPPFDGAVVMHKDNIKTNCTPGNLKWGTELENKEHRWQSGGYNQKITAEQAGQALQWLKDGMSRKEAAKKLGVSRATVDDIVWGDRRSVTPS